VKSLACTGEGYRLFKITNVGDPPSASLASLHSPMDQETNKQLAALVWPNDLGDPPMERHSKLANQLAPERRNQFSDKNMRKTKISEPSWSAASVAMRSAASISAGRALGFVMSGSLSKPELPSSGLMTACASCGHACRIALGRFVPIVLQKSQIARH
jgi:hypothetical protein